MMALCIASRRAWWLAVGLLLVAGATAAVADADRDGPTSANASGGDDPWRLGQSAGNASAEATHKPLLPLDTRDGATFVVGAIGLIIAAAGGIGGGGVLVPLFILVTGFNPKAAVALSNITMFGSAISNVALAASRRHPLHDKPLIDWSLIMIMEPPVIAGAVVGSLVNALLPSLVVTIFLVLTMSFMAKRTMTKGLKLWREEGGWQGVFGRGHTLGGELPTSQQQQQVGAEAAGEARGLLAGGNQARGAKKYGGATATLAELDEDAVRRIQDKERHVQLWQPLLLVVCFAGMALLQILKSATECGSTAYWLLALAVLPWVVPFFLLGRQHVLKDYKKKVIFGFPFHKGDVRWDESNSLRYPLLCSLAGLASGLFGVGGGMVKAPLLLEIGVIPAVQAATVATMILFTTGASTISLIVLGLMPRDYGFCFFFFGMITTGIGAAAVRQVLTKHKKQSIIVLSVGLIISTSVVTMGIQSLLRLVAEPESIMRFGSLCGGGGGEGE